MALTFLENNLNCLKSRNPDLGKILNDEFSPRKDLEVIQGPSGEITAKLEGNYLHSPRAPRREAVKFFKTQKSTPDILILMGFALGYHAEEYLNLHPKGTIWVIEPDIPLFLAACSARDISVLLSDQRMTLLLAPSPRAVIALMGGLPQLSFGVAKVRSVYEKDSEYYEDVENAISGVISRREINKNTLKRFGRLWVRNLLRNLPRLIEARGIHSLENRLRGLPVLLLAAGPSLEELLPHLNQLKKRMVLVAVDTALYALRQADCAPDFLVVVDPQFLNSRHLDGLSLEKSFLVADSSTHPRIFRTKPRGIFFSESPFPLGRVLEKGTDIKGRLGAGGSVATAAWETARFAGAATIYCGGLDLGFPDNQTHQKNSFFERRANFTSTRVVPSEEMSFMALRDGFPYWAKNNSGGQTLSDRRMEVYARWFELQVTSPSAPPTFNLSRQGIAMKGMNPGKLEDLLNLPEDRDEIDSRLSSLAQPLPAKEEFYKGLKTIEKELSRMVDLGQKGLNLLKGLDVLVAEKNESPIKQMELQHRLEQLDKIDREILSSGARQVAGFLFNDLIEELTAQSADGDAIENSRKLYSGLIESSAYHLAILEESMGRLNSVPNRVDS